MTPRVLLFGMLALSILSCTKSGSHDDEDSFDPQVSKQCSFKIINGESCPTGPGPMALLLEPAQDGKYVTLCSGAFISRNKILTAAHCGDSDSAGKLTVYTGDERVGITRFARHPRYIENGRGENLNDVAVITLAREVDIHPLPLLLSREVSEGDTLLLYGFGTDENGTTGIEHGLGNGVRKTHMTVLGTRFGEIISSYDLTGSGACVGDSGAPALAESESGNWGITGVVHGGTNTVCAAGTYELFTQIDREQITDFIMQEAPDVEGV